MNIRVAWLQMVSLVELYGQSDTAHVSTVVPASCASSMLLVQIGVCVSVAAGLPLVDARETFETCFLQAFILLKCDRSANSRGGVNNAGANPLKIQMSVQ